MAELASTGRPEDWAARRPDRDAVIDGRHRLSYAEWNLRADQLADGLSQLAPESTSACVLVSNRWEWFVIDLALAKLDWTHVALASRAAASEQQAAVRVSESTVVLTDAPHCDELERLLATDGGPPVLLVALEPGPAGAIPFDRLQESARPTARQSRRKPRMIGFTSGTTGRPKMVRHPQLTPRRHRTDAEAGADGRAAVSGTFVPASPQVALQALPLHHGAGPGGARQCHRQGGTCVVLDRYDPVTALRMIEQHRVTHWTAVPTMLHRIRALGESRLSAFDVSSMRMLAVGAAATPLPLKRWALEYFGECLYEGYGSSETGLIALMPPAGHLAKPGSCGRVRPGVQVSVRDRDGAELPAGADGELCVRSAITEAARAQGSIQSYHQDGMFATGDLGHVDADGYVYITGRLKDIIIRGGVNIAAEEIEGALSDCLDVAASAAIGIPDDDLGERIALFCQLCPGSSVDVEAIQRHLATVLPTLKRPAEVHLVSELPRTALGKVKKDQLRERFWLGTGFRFG